MSVVKSKWCQGCATGHFFTPIGSPHPPRREGSGECDPKCLSCLEVRNQLKLPWLLHWKVGRLRTAENPVHVLGSSAEHGGELRAARDETTGVDVRSVGGHSRDVMRERQLGNTPSITIHECGREHEGCRLNGRYFDTSDHHRLLMTAFAPPHVGLPSCLMSGCSQRRVRPCEENVLRCLGHNCRPPHGDAVVRAKEPKKSW
jgi:hypothetical protein